MYNYQFVFYGISCCGTLSIAHDNQFGYLFASATASINDPLSTRCASFVRSDGFIGINENTKNVQPSATGFAHISGSTTYIEFMKLVNKN